MDDLIQQLRSEELKLGLPESFQKKIISGCLPNILKRSAPNRKQNNLKNYLTASKKKKEEN